MLLITLFIVLGVHANISLRRATRRATSESRALAATRHHLNAVLEHAPIILFSCDQSGTITLSKGHGLQTLDRPSRSLVGTSIYDRYHDVPELIVLVKRALAGEECRETIRVGASHWETTCIPLRTSPGADCSVIGIATDVTRFVRAETALRESEARFRRFSEATIEGIVVHDQRVILDVNPAAARLFGFALDRMVGTPLTALVAPNTHPPLTDVMTTSSGLPREAFGRAQDESLVPLEVASKTIAYANETVWVSSLHNIAPRKLIEAALQSSEMQFRQLAENTDEFFWIATLKFDQMLYVSPAFEAIWGRSSADLYEQPSLIFETLHPDDYHLVSQFTSISEQATLATMYQSEYRIVRPDGSIRWIWSRVFPVRNKEGVVYRLAGISDDITARKRVEAALKESEGAIRTLYDITSEQHISFEERVAALIDMGRDRFHLPTGILSRISGQQYEIRAIKSHVHNIPVGTVLRLDDSYCNRTIYQSVPLGINHASASEWRTHPCYINMHVEAYLGTSVIVHGEVFGTLCFSSATPHEGQFSENDKDILRLMAQWLSGEIERSRAENALQQQYLAADRAQSESRAILDSTSEGIVLISPSGVLLSINRRFGELFDLPIKSIIGSNLQGVVPIANKILVDPQPVLQRLSDSLQDTEQSFTMIMEQQHPERRELAMFSTPVHANRGDYLGRLHVFRDVTHERAVDRMKSEFVSMVSHELRTPLTSIKGYVDMMLDGDAGEITLVQDEFLSIVKNNSDRLVGLINELLDIGRIESGNVKLELISLDLERVIRSVLELMRPQIASKQQTLTLHIANDMPHIVSDASHLTQILTNLVSNAHKYTHTGGAIAVCASMQRGRVEIAVQDTGIGVSAEEQAHLFTKFYRARNRTTQEVSGTGLGLAITRSLVEVLGGTIDVASVPGEGSTFRLMLPIHLLREEHSNVS